MNTLTLEWNAVINLEESCDPKQKPRDGNASLKKIIEAHGKLFEVGIVTTAASENTSKKTFPATAKQFNARLQRVGLEHIQKVYTQSTIDLTYFNYSIFAPNHGNEDLIKKIWEILPGSLPRSHRQFAKQNDICDEEPITSARYQKWRNKWCDVHSLLAHICAERDVFVSGDKKNFRGKKKQNLIDLGVGDICSYDEAWEYYGSS